MEYDESAKFFTYEDEDQDLWLLLTHTRYAVYRARELELQRYGTSPEQTGLLFTVQALGNKATPAEISRRMLRQPHTISALVERMVKKGLVKKVKDLDRKNLVRVEITKKGRQVYEQSAKRGPIHRIMNSLNPQEKQEFCHYLERILATARQEAGMQEQQLPASEF